MMPFFKVISTVLAAGFGYWLCFGWEPALALMLPVLTLGGCIALRGPTETVA